MTKERQFIPLNIAIMTVSDSRNDETDKSGATLVKMLVEAGHKLIDKVIVPDDMYRIRADISRWIVDEDIQVIISTGGTGLTGRDGTPEAVTPLLDKVIEGFGEMFRVISYDFIGASTMQSRTVAGTANGTFIFCLPGSTGACKDAWKHLLSIQLDYRTRPCNLVEIMPRLLEK
ncbi:MAG: molybdenum cofactor biosynthesis protein B [Gammaproteobacteria bacterium]|nr:molybdenum cofactor biosynthesis protein B [Gammaproteobacteria bacterium]